MSRNRAILTAILLSVCFFSSTSISKGATISQQDRRAIPQQNRRVVVRHRVAKRGVVKHNPQREKKLLHKGGWAAAGIAAGEAAGPAGSAAVGAAKYRHDLEAGGNRRTKAVAKIGAPIAAGAVAGPPGAAGVEVVEHRNWIKRHIFHRKPHSPRRLQT